MSSIAETTAGTPTAVNADEACPNCAARSWDALFEARDFVIGRCEQCHLVRTLGVVPEEVTYPAFEQSETSIVKAFRHGVAQLLRERARLAESVAPSSSKFDAPFSADRPRVLDVGCGSGSFARLMASRGFDAVGVEPFSLGRPVDEPHLKLVRAPLESVGSELGSFDVITMWHVLEHVSVPRTLLEAVQKLLRPNGVLIVSVPNFESWQSRVFKGGWFHLDPPRHVTHFTHATLTALFQELNLDVFEERTFHLEYGPVGWLQSSLNRILPRKNFLFEFIKDRGALASVPASQIALNLAASGAAGALLAGPALLVEAAAALRGAGSVITVAARNRPRS